MVSQAPFSDMSSTGASRDFRPRLPQASCLRLARVLLVDDARNDILLAKRFLFSGQGMGCELHTAMSAHEAMEIMVAQLERGEPIDLVLLDINMPGESGFQLLDLIRAQPGLNRVPVVMCTGSSHDVDRHQAMHLGAVGYVVKPPSLEKLRDILEVLPLLDIQEDGQGLRLSALGAA
ncbi:response regulator [Asticcacaulis solisilvae]|uniref:response regulator n=1 Tax=Asticcacaulis solisilvae TaxID=1217274 RepID=UPI003FD8EFE9